MYREVIIEALQKATGAKNIHLETPSASEHGDYSSNIAMAIFSKSQTPNSKSKTNYKSPQEIAQKIVEQLEKDKKLTEIIEKIEVAGPGFINFFLNSKTLIKSIDEVLREKENFGSHSVGKSHKVIIEYSSPNIAKYFGIGHLRSTVIGQALYNLYKLLGYKTIGENHLGDWGTQFGMIIAQVVRKNLDIKKLSVSDLERLYIEFNQELKEHPELDEEAREWFKKLEKGDKKAREIWQAAKEISLAEFKRIYELLGVEIDYMHGESFYEDKMKAVIEEVRKEGLSVKSEGAEIIEFKDLPPAMILKSDGATTYFTRDLAALKYRIDTWDPNLIVYEVGADQILHFRQVFATADALGWAKKKEFVHVAHGLIRSKDGKMSTRRGQTVKLEEVLDEAIKKARQIIEASETTRGLSEKEKEEVARKVGIGAIKYFDLMHHPTSDIVFDWEKMFVLEGNSGPYLQYTYARMQSVIKKFESQNSKVKITIQNSKIEGYEPNAEELLLLRTLVRFSDVTFDAAKNYSPNLLANYLFDLAQKFNTFYARHKILTDHQRQITGDFRVVLTAATGQVLKNGLTLLGLETPERM